MRWNAIAIREEREYRAVPLTPAIAEEEAKTRGIRTWQSPQVFQRYRVGSWDLSRGRPCKSLRLPRPI